MIDSNFRTPYQRLFIDPLLKWGLFNRVAPGWVTFLALLSGMMIPLCLYLHLSLVALACLALSGFFDTLDGSLARHRAISSSKGAVLDIASDRLVEFSIILGLYLYAPDNRGFMSLLMLGSIFLCVTTFLVVAIFQENSSEKSFHYSPGLIERAEAFIFFSLMILAPSFFTSLALLFSGLTLLTAFNRVSQFIKT